MNSTPATEAAPAARSLESKLDSRTIPALDGMRAVSVLLVVLGHSGVPFAPAGHGVMTFFVISGFLITWLLLREYETKGDVSLRQFYIRRALRLFPAFYSFAVVFAIVYWVVRGPLHWPSFVSALFYVSNYYLAIAHPADGVMDHTWSLAVEEQFYLLWPMLFVTLATNLRRLTLVLGLLIAVGSIHRLVLTFYAHASQTWLFCAFDCRADQLAVGCLMAILLKRSRAGGRLVEALCVSPVLPVITLGLIIASISVGFRLGEPYQFTAGFTIEPVLIAIFLLQMIAFSDHGFWQWTSWAPLRYIGKVSYGTYLYHWLVVAGIAKLLPQTSFTVKIPLAIGGSVLLAAISYALIEQPFLRRKEEFKRV